MRACVCVRACLRARVRVCMLLCVCLCVHACVSSGLAFIYGVYMVYIYSVYTVIMAGWCIYTVLAKSMTVTHLTCTPNNTLSFSKLPETKGPGAARTKIIVQ